MHAKKIETMRHIVIFLACLVFPLLFEIPDYVFQALENQSSRIVFYYMAMKMFVPNTWHGLRNPGNLEVRDVAPGSANSCLVATGTRVLQLLFSTTLDKMPRIGKINLL